MVLAVGMVQVEGKPGMVGNTVYQIHQQKTEQGLLQLEMGVGARQN
jgi:hypothetical protein